MLVKTTFCNAARVAIRVLISKITSAASVTPARRLAPNRYFLRATPGPGICCSPSGRRAWRIKQLNAALLGASPGASTAAPIMLNLLEKVFGDRVSSPQWQATLKAIVPSYGRKLNGDVAATERELQYTSEVLGLKYDKPQAADSTPKPQLKPQPVQKEVADIAL